MGFYWKKNCQMQLRIDFAVLEVGGGVKKRQNAYRSWCKRTL